MHVDVDKPVVFPKLPASQGPVQLAAVKPAVDPYRPKLQGPEQVEVVSPVDAPYNPAAQLVQAPDPAVLYVPTGQIAAVAVLDPATQLYPALQRPVQLAVASPVVPPYVPAGQLVHVGAAPRLYVPKAHMIDVALVEPAGQ